MVAFSTAISHGIAYRFARSDAIAHCTDVGDLVVHDDGLQRAARREPSASDLISAYFEIQEMLVHFWNPLWKPRKALPLLRLLSLHLFDLKHSVNVRHDL